MSGQQAPAQAIALRGGEVLAVGSDQTVRAVPFNQALREYKLKKKYELIKDGEKIKYCYMKMPNPLQENVLSIISVLPKEFKMNSYIDHELQFEKAFLDPLRSILNVIHWKEKPVSSLENFF